MIFQILGHAEALELLRADDLLQLLITDGKLLVLRVLQVVLLYVGPHLLDNLVPGGFLNPDNCSKIFRQGQTFVEAAPSALPLFLGLVGTRSGVGI